MLTQETKVKYIIVGNGVAGTEAALAIRKVDAQGEITLISADAHHFYYRPRLIEYLAGTITLSQLTLYKESLYKEKGINVILNTKITTLDADQKWVKDTQGNMYTYDKILLATGADCFIPPIPGIDSEGIFTVRNVEDCDHLRTYCSGKKQAVVLGGGLLGLEVAHSLLALQQKVTVIETADWLLSRQLDEPAGALLKSQLEQQGITFMLADSVAKVVGDTRVTSLVLASGKVLPAEVLVVSAGIRGCDQVAQEIGASCNRGIVVDDYLQTSVPHVYAAGDLIEHNGVCYGVWPASRQQGITVGANMAGTPTKYSGTDFSVALKVAGISLFSAGDIHATDVEVLVKKTADTYRKLLCKDDTLVGALVMGETSSLASIRSALAGKISVSEMKNKIKLK